LSALVAAAVIACTSGDRAGATVDTAVIQSKAPPTDSSVGGSIAVDSADSAATADSLATPTGPTFVLLADSAAGETLFRRSGKCLACHGPTGGGLQGLGADLRDADWLHGDGSLAFVQRTIRDGIARPAVSPIAMPASASTLTPEEIYRIAAYVYTLSHPGSAVADTTGIVPVDTGAMADTTRPKQR
jgi:mono/diheme cytochrome c family protein